VPTTASPYFGSSSRIVWLPAFPRYLGIELTAAEPDRLAASVMVREETGNGQGSMHGGALMAVADTLGAIGTLINLRPGQRTTTIESKTNFIAAAPIGARLLAEAVPLHRGRTTQIWQTRISRENGRLVAIVIQTQLVLATSPALPGDIATG
jgi:uncharacterized protein (TIGR00369 family)